MQILINFLQGKTLVLESQNLISAKEIKNLIENVEGIPTEYQRLRIGSHEIHNSEFLQVTENFVVVDCSLRILGGKGGFGALLRGSGSHSKSGAKNIGFDDCRDLNGRRIRNVKNEKKLEEWYNQQKQKEIENLQKKTQEQEKISEEEKAQHLEQVAWNQTREELEETIANSVEIGIKKALKMKKKKKPEPETKVSIWGFDDEEEEEQKEEEEKEEEKKEKKNNKKGKQNKIVKIEAEQKEEKEKEAEKEKEDKKDKKRKINSQASNGTSSKKQKKV